MFFYLDNNPKTKFTGSVWEMDANKMYMNHYNNWIMLHFFAKSGTRVERVNAEKEIIICNKKLKFWENHPNFDAKHIQKEKEKALAPWRGRI